MYSEAQSTVRWPFALLVIVGIAGGAGCWLLPLSEGEATFAVAARQMAHSGQWFVVDSGLPPLPVWLLAAVALVTDLNELIVRLVFVLPMLGLAGMCAWIGYRIAGRPGAAVSAATVMCSAAMLAQFGHGSGETWYCLLLNAAWLTWFYYVRESKNWGKAWLFSLALVGLATMSGGIKGLFFFYLPLCLLRRPINIWRRLWQVEHGLGLLLIGGVTTGLMFAIPGMRDHLGEFLTWSPESTSGGLYLVRLFTFPLLIVVFTAPWTGLLWPAYCAGFRPLESHPVLGQYLRAVIVPMVLYYWVIPGGNLAGLLPLIGPVALLVALHYRILVRRHGRPLIVVPQVLAYMALLAALMGILMLGGATLWGVIARLPTVALVGGGICLAASLAFSFIVLGNRRVWPLWLTYSCASAAVFLAFSGLVYPFGTLNPARERAESLMANVPDDAVLNVMGAELLLGPVDYYYLDRPFHWSAPGNYYDLEGGKEVYVLKPGSVPVNRFREWSTVSVTDIDAGAHKYRIWQGTPRTQTQIPIPAETPGPGSVSPLNPSPGPEPSLPPLPQLP